MGLDLIVFNNNGVKVDHWGSYFSSMRRTRILKEYDLPYLINGHTTETLKVILREFKEKWKDVKDISSYDTEYRFILPEEYEKLTKDKQDHVLGIAIYYSKLVLSNTIEYFPNHRFFVDESDIVNKYEYDGYSSDGELKSKYIISDSDSDN